MCRRKHENSAHFRRTEDKLLHEKIPLRRFQQVDIKVVYISEKTSEVLRAY